MSRTVEFMRKDPKNDSAKLESICPNCPGNFSLYGRNAKQERIKPQMWGEATGVSSTPATQLA